MKTPHYAEIYYTLLSGRTFEAPKVEDMMYTLKTLQQGNAFFYFLICVYIFLNCVVVERMSKH